MDMQNQMPQGGMDEQRNGMAEKIRQAAQQALNPQELQIVAQSVTPQFVQVMAKLFGDQAVMLLTPLVNLQSNPYQPPTQQAANALNSFSAPEQGEPNEGPERMEEPDNYYPTPVRFGRR